MNTYATVGGGYSNDAGDYASTISGGYNNSANANYSTVGGGATNYIDTNATYATIPGGRQNEAFGDYSFAAGRKAQAWGDGAFVWADATDDTLGGWVNNIFIVRASGGYCLYSNAAENAGVKLTPGSSTWIGVSDSTKKRNIHLVDTREILDRVAQLPIKQWSYKSQDPSIEHIGPMAQDFYKLFHLGEDSLGISTIDPAGIALAAIQELQKQNAELKAKLSAHDREIDELRAMISKMAAFEGTKAAAYAPRGD
jgi:hypothetical protein